ncbi:phage tail assembly chaperone, partial [Proteus mirabilis]
NTQSYLRMIQAIPEMSPTEILLEVIEAWEFDESLNSANMTKLIDNCPQAAFAIMEAFGRLIHSREIQQIWGQKWLM